MQRIKPWAAGWEVRTLFIGPCDPQCQKGLFLAEKWLCTIDFEGQSRDLFGFPSIFTLYWSTLDHMSTAPPLSNLFWFSGDGKKVTLGPDGVFELETISVSIKIQLWRNSTSTSHLVREWLVLVLMDGPSLWLNGCPNLLHNWMVIGSILCRITNGVKVDGGDVNEFIRLRMRG